MKTGKKCWSAAAVLVLATTGVVAGSTAASADDLEVIITGGSLAFELSNPSLAINAAFSLSEQTVPSSTSYLLQDLTATNDGWIASVDVPDDIWDNGMTYSIAKTAFLFDSDATTIAADPGPNGGNMTGVTKGSTGTLGAGPRTVFEATDGNGSGVYTGNLAVNAVIPAAIPPTTLTGTVNLTIVPQP